MAAAVTPFLCAYSITACLNRIVCVILFMANRVTPAFRFCLSNLTLTQVTPIRSSFYLSHIIVTPTLPRTSSLSWLLITSSFSCTIFSDMVCCLLSEWCVTTSFYQSSANHVSFFLLFNLRNLLYLITECLRAQFPPPLCQKKKKKIILTVGNPKLSALG